VGEGGTKVPLRPLPWCLQLVASHHRTGTPPLAISPSSAIR
jgi:hypothetical protein